MARLLRQSRPKALLPSVGGLPIPYLVEVRAAGLEHETKGHRAWFWVEIFRNLHEIR